MFAATPMSSRLSRTFTFAAALSIAAISFEGLATACAVCQSGTPVTTPTPSPRAGADGASRVPLTVALDVRVGAAAVNRLRVDEGRIEVLASYDFPARISVDLGLPFLSRTVSDQGARSGLNTDTAAGPREDLNVGSLGDLESRVRYLAWRRHESSLSLFGGAKWPTAPVATGPDGSVLPAALQPGCSSIAPLLGAAAVWGLGEWTVSAVGQILLPFSIREAPHPGDSIRLSGTAERGLTKWLAVRTSLTLRLETGGALGTDAPDPNSGGAVLYAGTEFVFRPLFRDVPPSFPRFQATLGVTFPVVQGFFGVHRETAVLGTSLAMAL